MSKITVTIASDGTATPSHIPVTPGDTVAFHADGADTVLCIDPDSYFGAERYEIPARTAIDLTVQAGASGTFEFITQVGDLNARCRGVRDRQSGGSGTGGGVD